MQGSLIEVLVALCIFSASILGAGFMMLNSMKLAQDALRLTQQLIQPSIHEVL